VYNGSLDNVDIWAAGMLETTPEGPGPLFQAIIRNQFRRIRSGDRFWFENYKQNRCDAVTYYFIILLKGPSLLSLGVKKRWEIKEHLTLLQQWTSLYYMYYNLCFLRF